MSSADESEPLWLRVKALEEAYHALIAPRERLARIVRARESGDHRFLEDELAAAAGIPCLDDLLTGIGGVMRWPWPEIEKPGAPPKRAGGDEASWEMFWREVEAIEKDYDAGLIDGPEATPEELLRAIIGAWWTRDRAGLDAALVAAGGAYGPWMLRPLPAGVLAPQGGSRPRDWCRILRRAVRRAASLCLIAPDVLGEGETAEEQKARWKGKGGSGPRKFPQWAFRAAMAVTSHPSSPYAALRPKQEKEEIHKAREAWAAAQTASLSEWDTEMARRQEAAMQLPEARVGEGAEELRSRLEAAFAKLAAMGRKNIKTFRAEREPFADEEHPFEHPFDHWCGTEGAFNVAWEMLLDFTEGRPDQTSRGREFFGEGDTEKKVRPRKLEEKDFRAGTRHLSEQCAHLHQELGKAWRSLYKEGEAVWPADVDPPIPPDPLADMSSKEIAVCGVRRAELPPS